MIIIIILCMDSVTIHKSCDTEMDKKAEAQASGYSQSQEQGENHFSTKVIIQAQGFLTASCYLAKL